MRANFETGLKICSTCQKELPFTAFYKCKSTFDGMQNQCKDCAKRATQTESYKEKRKEAIKRYKSSEKGILAEKRYRESEKGKIMIHNQNQRRYLSGKNALYIRKKRKTDCNFAIKENLRNRIYYAIKDAQKSKHTLELLGCSIEYLKDYLEKQFEPGMSWDNYGEWHIDHIIPCSYFDLTDPIQQQICFNFRNLQPLWAKDNNQKKNKLPENYQEIFNQIKEDLICQ